MSKLLDIVNGPWAIQPEKLQEIRAIYETHLKGEKINLDVARQQTGLPLENGSQGYNVVDGTAIIPVVGVIAKRMNLFHAISGGASTELVARDIRDALADPRVHSIILHIDSPGGTVDGTPALADLVREAGTQKTVVAFADGLIASAAYWIGSAASAIYIDGPTTEVGSIGVVARHVDVSQSEAKQGIKTTEISSGKYKRIASSYGPLSEEGRQSIQERTDYLYSIFVETIAANRGVSVDTVLQKMADGRIFIGQQAIDAGLVDGVSTLDALIASLANGNKPTTRPAGVAGREEPIHSTDKGITMSITKDFIAQNHPDIAEAFRNEGYSQGRSEGETAGAARERDRILAVEAQALPGYEALITTLKADGKTSGPEAAAQIVAAQRARLGKQLTDLAEDAPAPVPSAPAPSNSGPGAGDDRPIEERCKATWEKDAKIRAEFVTFEGYLGYEKAANAGRVHILKKN
jgi:signal peptide peptidase SppA